MCVYVCMYVGTYSFSGADTCLNCPPGHFCPSPSSAPLECPQGTWSGSFGLGPGGGGVVDDGTTGIGIGCQLCPAGYSCDNSSSSLPLPCPPGSYSLAGATQVSVKLCLHTQCQCLICHLQVPRIKFGSRVASVTISHLLCSISWNLSLPPSLSPSIHPSLPHFLPG